VDALSAQPLGLVEAVRRPGRRPQLAEQPQPGALRRYSAERQLEQDRLVRPQRSPAENECPHPLVERSRPRRLLDLDERAFECPDPFCEHAPVQLCEAKASPAPARKGNGAGSQRPANARIAGRAGERGERRRHEQRRDQGQASDVRERAAKANRAGESVRQADGHGASSGTTTR